MLHYFVNHRLNENQHGHRIGRGTLTCWRVILTKVIRSPYIFEFDFMKFHDRIDRGFLAKSLKVMNFPESEVRKFVHLCSPYIRGTDERDPMRLKTMKEWKFHHYYRGVVQGSNIAALLALIVLEVAGVYDLKKGNYIGYADDGILYGDNPDMVKEFLNKLTPENGIEIKKEKSG